MKERAKSTSDLLRGHRHLWGIVTRNPFLQGIRDGTLPPKVFNRWLVQDRFFVDGLFATQARILAAAPVRERPYLVRGLSALQDELDWFDRMLSKRRLGRRHDVHPIARAYIDYITTLAFAPYPAAITALWAQYRAYLDAWSWARPGAPAFREFVRHWSSRPFAKAVKDLQGVADRALRTAGTEDRAAAAEAFEQTARYELDFWVMVLEPD